MKRKILLSLIVSIACLLALEIVLRQFVEPCKKCYGLLFGKELPPYKLIPDRSGKSREEKLNLWERVTVGGKRITVSDFWGRMRDDDLIGYTPEENSVSTNGWWQSNNFGARSSRPSTPEKEMNIERVLVFGDSNTQGVAIPEDETFVYFLNEKMENTEFLNFGVSGYSVGQAYLRYQNLKDKLEYDRVFLVIAPRPDLWREINVNRYLAEGWHGDFVYNSPIFVLEDGKLKFIHKPYRTAKEFQDDNRDSIEPRYRNFLKKYDYFYDKCKYDSEYILDDYIIFKLLKKFYCHFNWMNEWELKYQMDTSSDAVKITRAIIEAMSREAQSKGAKFSLVILPLNYDIKQYAENPGYKKSWDEMAAFICPGDFTCYDLMKDLQTVPVENLDTGYEYGGEHYGPKTNALIADFIIKNAFQAAMR